MKRYTYIFAILSMAFVGYAFIDADDKPIQDKPIQTEETVVDESELTWYTRIGNAHKVSQETNKPIFAFFTGSDWCGWCHKLQREVFAKDAFKKWAKENVVLLELDFPRRKKLDPEIQQQNKNLQQVLGVRGYPTIWIFNTTLDTTANNLNINALGSLGYPRGAVKGKEEVKFLENANKILANDKTGS